MPAPLWDIPAVGASVGRLEDILRQYVLPELAASRRRRGEIESAFLGQISSPESYYGSALKSAQGYANELFKPGGQVAQLISRARGKAISQGFAPEGATGSELGILREATGAVSDRFAQEAAGLEANRLNTFGSTYNANQQGLMQLLASLFAGQASIESLRASEREKGLLGLGILGL